MLTDRQCKVNLIAKVREIGEIKEWNRNGRKGRVATAICESEEGKVFISVFNKDLDKLNELSTKGEVIIKVIDGFAKHYTPPEGEMMVQVSAGKEGVLEIKNE